MNKHSLFNLDSSHSNHGKKPTSNRKHTHHHNGNQSSHNNGGKTMAKIISSGVI